jgi:glycerol uptake facilitator-like aquaporin
MFGLPVLQVSAVARDAGGQWISEIVATSGLLLTVLALAKTDKSPVAVGLYVTGAYWFTASTCFANPAVTIARSLSDTFAGIAPSSAVGFIGAEFIGALIAIPLASWLFAPR